MLVSNCLNILYQSPGTLTLYTLCLTTKQILYKLEASYLWLPAEINLLCNKVAVPL